jgi:thioredoxin-related protein
MSIMKNLLLVCALAFSTVAMAANANWLADLEKAKTEAKTKKLPILVDFSGSEWCGWCKKLDKEVFDQKAFADYASKNLILVKLDFPRGGGSPANAQLAQKYGVKGFPTVLLMDETGKVLAQTGYQDGGAAKYVEHLKSLLKKK